MKTTLPFFAIVLSMALVPGCKSEPAGPEDVDRIPIRISSSVTKVSGDQFNDGDAVGIYVVNASEASEGSWSPGTLEQSGNHLDNVEFTLSGDAWSAAREYYWKDGRTQAEFYCYYPYVGGIGDVSQVTYEIPSDQSGAQAFNSAEILWGKTGLTAPTEDFVRIGTTHRMSQIAISIVPGKGYTEESLREELKSVRINSIRCGAVLDLRSGSLTATGEEKDIVPYEDNGVWRAMIVPQTVTDRVLITLDVNGMERTLTKSIEFSSNSRKKCTLTINKISEGINVGIGGWEDDDTDYGGVLN